MSILEGINKINDEEILELHSEIQKYSSVLEKLKSDPGLRNYHKFYQKKLKFKSLLKVEHDLAKTQQLIPPGIGTEHNFSIYHFFEKLSKTHSLKISVIDTLIFSKSKGKIIYLKNNEKGVIVQNKTDDHLGEFLKGLHTPCFQNFPICIYKPNEGKNVLFKKIEEVIDFCNKNAEIEGIFQKFVSNSADHLTLLRVHWKNHAAMRGYLIGKSMKKHYVLQNHERKSRNMSNLKLRPSTKVTQIEKKMDSISNEALISHVHDIIEHRHQRLRINTNFKHFENMHENLDEKSCLLDIEPLKSNTSFSSFKDELESKCFRPWEELNSDKIGNSPLEKFIIDGINPKNTYVTELKKIYPEIIQLTSVISTFLGSFFHEKKKNMNQFTVDFLKDNKKWVLLKVDKVLICENNSAFQTLNLVESEAFTNFIPNFLETLKKEELPTIKNIPSKRCDPPLLHKRTMSNFEVINPIKKTVTPEIHEINLENVKKKMERFVNRVDSIPMKSICLDKKNEDIIQNYEKNYDSLVTNVKIEQESQKKLGRSMKIFESYEKNCKNKITKKESQKTRIEHSIFKNNIKDYNSMMVHVRRINLKNKKPLMEVYGGESFWKQFVKIFYSKISEYEHLTKFFMNISSQGYNSMMYKGLPCLFNSHISLEFRRNIRTKHKKLAITCNDFKMFGSCFIKALQEIGVKEPDIEIIYDNYNSFLGAIAINQHHNVFH